MNYKRALYGRKSQTELLGFAIVVLLIAVGMLFVIGFIVLDSKTDSRATYLYKQTATNLNDAMLETTTTCKQLTLRELYVACIDSPDMKICPMVDDVLGANTLTACTYLQGFVKNRLDETLKPLGYNYQYSYRYGAVNAPAQWNESSARYPFTGCSKQRSPLVLSADNGQVIIYLDIYDCVNRN